MDLVRSRALIEHKGGEAPHTSPTKHTIMSHQESRTWMKILILVRLPGSVIETGISELRAFLIIRFTS